MNKEVNTENKRKRNLYIVVTVLAIASLTFRILNDTHFEQTAIFFVGIPTLITLILIKYAKTPKSAYGVVFMTITLFLLLSAILFGEGLVCIIFMAPIFYGVAALLVFIYEYLKKRNKSNLNSFIILPLVLIISQFTDINTTPKTQTVITSKIVKGNYDLSVLEKHPDFLANYPNFFKIGFPKPISISGKGINVGDSRKIQFESKTRGTGTLHLRVKKVNKNSITYEIAGDNTHIHHWLTWKEIEVSIKKQDNDTSKITWTTKFTCDLGPNWYFEPFEKYGVKVMNEHLIQSFFN